MFCETVAKYNMFPSAPMELKKVFADNAWKLLDGIKVEYIDVNADNIHTLFCIWSKPYTNPGWNREDLRQMFDARLDEVCNDMGIQGDVEIVDINEKKVAMFKLQWQTENVAGRMMNLVQYGANTDCFQNDSIQTRLF